MANSENESVWDVLGEARLGATGDMPFAYRVGLPDEPEIIDVSTKKIIKPRAIRIKNVTLTELLDRIEAALKRTGNAAAMREALKPWIAFGEWLLGNAGKDKLGEAIRENGPIIRQRLEELRAVLAAPPRNCDVGTAKEQNRRFERYCDSEVCECKMCKNVSKYLVKSFCALAWAQRPYEGGAHG